MDKEIRIGEHIVDKLDGGIKSQSAESKLDEWLQASQENKDDLKKYQQIWEKATEVSQIHNYDTESAWHKVDTVLESRNISTRKIRNIVYVVSGIAASLLIFLSLSFYSGQFSTPETKIAITTTYGSRSVVVLPDGSIVKLNAGSSLEYHFDKKLNIRTVDFSGEGFFDVAKNQQPFVVQTADGLILKVLGTKFNLSTYLDDPLIQTSLVEGEVELSRAGSANLTLTPGQIASFDKKSTQLGYSKGEVSQNIGWMQNKLYMDNMSLQDVCTRLERWYDVDIILNEISLGQKIHYTGVLKEQTVKDVLEAMCNLSTISYMIKGKQITISKK